VSWTHTFEADEETVYFAFTYPYSYQDLQMKLASLEERLETESKSAAGSILFQRELLGRSIEGRRLDLVTITSSEASEDRPVVLFTAR